jgi:hypothetical protein
LRNEHAPYARLGTGQQTTKGSHTVVDKLITPSGLAPSYRTWAVLAVRCKIAYCNYSVKAVKLFKNVFSQRFDIQRFCFYERIVVFFLRFILFKGQFYEIMNYFSTCWGGPLYGPAVYSKIHHIRESGFSSPLFLKIVDFKGAILAF